MSSPLDTLSIRICESSFFLIPGPEIKEKEGDVKEESYDSISVKLCSTFLGAKFSLFNLRVPDYQSDSISFSYS